ncbi:hypothetical protein MADP07_00736 [Mycoplasma anatis]|uniref:5'-nucleotidase, lipoprotein e(P4) family n=1 Tax=Mycoplasmopsis anatis TaxID=171279 RepID=A0A9Q3L8N2_9BACT|nr:HAD family acid phosphatase [Mycoplasmopsis anatis]MBW0596337.1 hypothetical protein [Mycoplasmopsis anatis]MBW0597125.1 hypothetical protein [Mycoplasmopsis anatis]MBW0597554.1 hypothetical protein [Mycoplasmopsis anatis]MBW0599929.1 hypothetical protein [Mycoplasmopsis anatis]MBW0600714.1 hypothetical protein [Mycoplasmopsis anatis]
MTKRKILTLGLASTVVALPLLSTAISCTDSKEVNELKAKIEKMEKDHAKELEDQKALAKVALNSKLNASSNLWNTLAPEKSAMGLTIYNLAKHAFDVMSKQENIVTNKVIVHKSEQNTTVEIQATNENEYIPVVFMDLDETVLNNIAYQNWLLLNNQTYNGAEWAKFVNSAVSTEVKGAIEFIKYVYDHGGVVMFNSNRQQRSQIEPSKLNLNKLGLDNAYMPNWIWWMKGTNASGTSDKPWTTTTGTSSKEERMNFVSTNKLEIEEGKTVAFRVVMKVGDDINDFNDNFTKDAKAVSDYELVNNLINTSAVGKLYGNLDLNNKEQFYNPTTKQWETRDWSASYILIPGNASYGSFIERTTKSRNPRIELYESILSKFSEFNH